MSVAILCTAAGMSDIVNKSRMCIKSIKLTEATRHAPTFSCPSLLKSEPALLCPEELKFETNKYVFCDIYLWNPTYAQIKRAGGNICPFLHFQDPNTYKVKKNAYLI